MTPYRFGDVVLVEFPFTNLQDTKQRPAVVISQNDYNAGRPDVILMAVTSQVRLPLTVGEVLLTDWQEAGLLLPSMLKPVIATVQQDIIKRVLGQLSPSDIGHLKTAVQTILKP